MTATGLAWLAVVALTAAGCSATTPTPSPSAPPSSPTRPVPSPSEVDGRPFPVPVTTRQVDVPATIDATGATDVAEELGRYIASVPDGTLISFPLLARHLIRTALSIGGRSHLVLEGNGSTLQMASNDWSGAASVIQVWDSHDIAIRGFTLLGNSSSPGVLIDGHEHAHGVNVFESTNVEIADSIIDRTWGDFLEIGGERSWSDGIWYHDVRGLRAGRSGISVLAARNVTVERSRFDQLGLMAFNIEPWQAAGGGIGISFVDNTVGSFGHGAGAGRSGMFFAAEGEPPNTVRDVLISRNRVTNDSLAAAVTRLHRRSGITFTDNVSDVTATGPVLTFAHVDGLTVTGNVQRLRTGQLLALTDCTAVVTQ